MALAVDTVESLAAKFSALLPHLDERQQRLYLASEARALGHGGIAAVARAAGVSRQTVTTGVDELESGQPPLHRARHPGAGRKRLTQTDPTLRPALLALVEPDQRGDPMSALRWTVKSTRNLANELTTQGHQISADTVADLLRQEGFSLQGNAKTLEGKQNPDRDAQFRYLNDQVTHHQATDQPVISVDTKKKELIGPFKNAGRQWRPAGQPTPVDIHDFPDTERGKAVPYGIYDLATNTGWVNVGTDHDTAAFAVESIRRWWNSAGQRTYPHASRLLITADAGGSNGYRTRAWKTELATLAAQTGLAITVCHFPPGTSKWNRIEHRLFSHITLNWQGTPLTSHEVILNTIAATTTRTGLTVHAQLDTDTYTTGVRISDDHLNALPLDRHDWHGEWNYTLRPDTPTPAPTATADPTTDPTTDPVTDPVPERPNPDRAWLHRPAITGLSQRDWDSLITTLTAPHHAQQEAQRARRRGYQPRRTTRTTPRPGLSLADRLAATLLHHRRGLPQTTIAALFGVRPETINRYIRDLHHLLDQTGHTIHPTPHRLAHLDDLYNLARTAAITIPTPTKPAS